MKILLQFCVLIWWFFILALKGQNFRSDAFVFAFIFPHSFWINLVLIRSMKAKLKWLEMNTMWKVWMESLVLSHVTLMQILPELLLETKSLCEIIRCYVWEKDHNSCDTFLLFSFAHLVQIWPLLLNLNSSSPCSHECKWDCMETDVLPLQGKIIWRHCFV